MIKLVVFDIDGTLAGVGEPIREEHVSLLKRIEDAGCTVALSSGKSVFYQMGMFRQVGLKNPVFIGENGCSIAFGVHLPPKVLKPVRPESVYFASRARILEEMQSLCPDRFWLQPNEVMLTLFFRDSAVRDAMRSYFKGCNYPGITVYEHVDSFDVVPEGMDKHTGLARLCRELHIRQEEVMAVGDGINDIPMMEFCKYSIGVGGLDSSLTTYHFDEIGEALAFLLAFVRSPD